MTTNARLFVLFAAGLLCFSAFTNQALAHNDVWVMRLVNLYDTPNAPLNADANMCIGDTRIKRVNIPIQTAAQKPNIVCEDDILQRVSDPKRPIVMWFIGATGSTLEGRGDVIVFKLADRLADPNSNQEHDPTKKYIRYTWALFPKNTVPLDQLYQKTHALLQAMHADYAFETVSEIENNTDGVAHTLLNGKELAAIPSGENRAIIRQDLIDLGLPPGKPAVVTIHYGTPQTGTQGGKYYTLSTGSDGKWQKTSPIVLTNAEKAWASQQQAPSSTPVTVVNKNTQWSLGLTVKGKTLAVIPPGSKCLLDASVGPAGPVTISLVYLDNGKPVGGEFRVYHAGPDGLVRGSSWEVNDPRMATTNKSLLAGQ